MPMVIAQRATVAAGAELLAMTDLDLAVASEAATTLDAGPPSIAVPAGQAIVDVLVASGIVLAFGIPGGHILGVYDAIDATDGIRSVLVRHEFTAAALAAGYAQLTGRPALVLATAGPGVTNTLTAVAEAYVGALPMIVLAGRGPTDTVYRGASQEIDTDQVFRPVTKWSVRVDRADLLADTVAAALRVATTGRPGPVLIDIPRDLLNQTVAPPRASTPAAIARLRPDALVSAEIARVLAGAQHPLLVAGGGVIMSDAAAQVVTLAERLGAPVLTSLAGRGAIGEEHPLAAGGLGAHRNPAAKRLLVEADVVLVLGARFEEMETNWQPGALPSPEARVIQVDINPAEHARSIPWATGVAGDIRATLEDVLAELADHQPAGDRGDDVARLADELAALEIEIGEHVADDSVPVNPVRVIREAREVFPRDTVLGVDVGALAQHIAGAFPYFRVHEPRSTLVPSSFYGMGFVASALPVVPLVHPSRPAVCFVGDGSFQMVMTVLPVAADYALPVTWIVLDDGALGSIWDIQHHVFNDRIVDTAFDFRPDFAALAGACGCHGENVTEPAELRGALERARRANLDGRPAVVSVSVSRLRLQQTREHYFRVFPQD